MLEFEKVNDSLVLEYDTTNSDNDWLYRRLNNDETVCLKNTFHVTKEDLYGSSTEVTPNPDIPVEFNIGKKHGEYFLIHRRILSIEFDLWIHQDIPLTYRSFTAEKNVSIFSKVSALGAKLIRIGGNHPDSIPEEDFNLLIKYFPNTYELRLYVEARVSAIIRDYFETKYDGEKKYHQYLNKKIVNTGEDLIEIFKDNEIIKYTLLQKKLTDMLNNENTYSEAQWQDQIVQIILLLYPKYIRVFKSAKIRDTYNQKTRELDFLLVDSSGNTDIVEIKQPFDKCIVTNSQYRDNYIPLRELSGTVMQIEKYIFYLNKWGRAGEMTLSERYQDRLPDGFSIKITNPSGIIVMGRDENLKSEQKQDFEVIKRKYKNIVDIITYDDLLARLRFTITQLENHT